MRILLTGVTGYVGRRLIPFLLNEGHELICCVRNKSRFDQMEYDSDQIEVIELDFLNQSTLDNIPNDIDAAYYLIHSMTNSLGNFENLELKCASNFRTRIDEIQIKQVVYLSGITNEDELSEHLQSRLNVEQELAKGKYALTVLRAGIVVGSGSASFEIMRDLVEKLPVMITPKWVNTRCQPIAIRNVLQYLAGVLMNAKAMNRTFDIGGPEVLTYKEMLLKLGQVRGLRRYIFTLPIMTPRLSSYWLYFVTSTSYKLAMNLVDSMHVDVVCQNDDIKEVVSIELLSYNNAVSLAFDKIKQQDVISSWTDAWIDSSLSNQMSALMQVPDHGCLSDEREAEVKDRGKTMHNLWSIGGNTGWYYGNWMWSIRGFLDKLVGGVGLRRGRRNPSEITAGESLDFWRVLYASREEGRLLLFAEMKIPGEAWLEFKLKKNKLIQTATFRPKGLWGRLYWFMLWPMHHFIFGGMVRRIAT